MLSILNVHFLLRPRVINAMKKSQNVDHHLFTGHPVDNLWITCGKVHQKILPWWASPDQKRRSRPYPPPTARPLAEINKILNIMDLRKSQREEKKEKAEAGPGTDRRQQIGRAHV